MALGAVRDPLTDNSLYSINHYFLGQLHRIRGEQKVRNLPDYFNFLHTHHLSRNLFFLFTQYLTDNFDFLRIQNIPGNSSDVGVPFINKHVLNSSCNIITDYIHSYLGHLVQQKFYGNMLTRKPSPDAFLDHLCSFWVVQIVKSRAFSGYKIEYFGFCTPVFLLGVNECGIGRKNDLLVFYFDIYLQYFHIGRYSSHHRV